MSKKITEKAELIQPKNSRRKSTKQTSGVQSPEGLPNSTAYGKNQVFGYDIQISPKNKDKSNLSAFHIDLRSDVHVDSGFDRLGFTSSNAGIINDDELMIYEYRKLSLDDTIEFALGEIKNASFTNNEPGEYVIGIEFIENVRKNKKISKALKNRILQAFYHVYDKLNFSATCRSYFLDWYIDSRIVFHKVIDPKNISEGIQDLIKIEATQIKRVTVYPEPDPMSGVYNLNDVRDVYVYHHRNLTDYSFGRSHVNNAGSQMSGSSYGGNYIFINPDVVTYVDSGLVDRNTRRVIGYLQNVILPYNKYMMMEDSMVIFRITRAPSRLAIYVDVGNKNGTDAEKTLNQVKNDLKSTVRYDVSGDKVTSRSDIMSLTENYYLTRTKDGNTTQIEQLQGGDFDGVLEETEFFGTKLKRSTHVPLGRWNDGEGGGDWLFGRGTGHQLREEQRFEEFIYDVKLIYTSGLFDDLIKTQLMCEGVIDTDEDWDDIRSCFEYSFVESNLIVEYKKHELLGQRSASARDYIELAERGWVTDRWVQKNVLYLTDEEIENMTVEAEEYAEQTADINNINDDYGLNDVGDVDELDGEDPDIDVQYDDDGNPEVNDKDVTDQPEDEVGETQDVNQTRPNPNRLNRGNKPKPTKK